jgi:hypothetical protein
LYYYNANKSEEINGRIKEIVCVYVVHRKEKEVNTLKLWAYTFTNPFDMTSIKLLKSAEYRLIRGE